MSFCFLNTNAQFLNKINNEKPSSTNLFGEIAMLEVEYFDNNGDLDALNGNGTIRRQQMVIRK